MSSEELPLEAHARARRVPKLGTEAQHALIVEATPLLNEDDFSPSTPPHGISPYQPLLRRLGLSTIVLYCMLLNFLLEFSNSILTVPLISLYENSICRTHYQQSDSSIWNSTSKPDESMCKIPAVQSELAFVRGWKAFFDTLAALLLSLPIGSLADRYSRYTVYAVVLIGLMGGLLWTVLVASSSKLPVRLVWGSSVFYLIGGGNYAAEMILDVIVSDATTDADRTRIFYYIYSCFILTELVGPPIAAATASTSVWIPIVVGLCSLGLCFPVIILMPKTDNNRNRAEAPETETSFVDAGGQDVRAGIAAESDVRHSFKTSNYTSLFKTRNMLLALPIFLIGTFRAISLRVLVTYTSVRFGWELSKTNLLITEVAAVNLILFIFVLPRILASLQLRRNLQTQTVNLIVIRSSLLILTVGALLLAFSPTSSVLCIVLAIYATGFGARATTLSLVTSWFASELRARLYSAVLLVELFGMLVGEPFLQFLFGTAVHLPRVWLGLPFISASICYLIAWACAMSIRLR